MPTHGVRILVRFVSRVGGCLFVCPFVCLLALVWMSVCSFVCLLLRGCLFVSCACVRFVVCAFVCLLLRAFVTLFEPFLSQVIKPKSYYEPAPV